MWNMFDLKGGRFPENFSTSGSISYYIPKRLFYVFFDPGRTARARSCIFKAGDEERLHIFLGFFGWLAAGFRVIAFLAGGGRPGKQSDGGQLLLFYKEKWGCWVAQKLNRMIPNIPPFVEVFLLCLRFSS